MKSILRKQCSQTIGGISFNLFTEICERGSPYCSDILSPTLLRARKGSISLSIPYKPNFSGNPNPESAHGGVTASVVDHAGGFCAWSTLSTPGQLMRTVDLSVQYIKPLQVLDEGLICDAEVINVGSSEIRVDMICWNLNRTKKIATGRGLYSAYERKNRSKVFTSVVNRLFECNSTVFIGQGLLRLFKALQLRKSGQYNYRVNANDFKISRRSLDDDQYNGLSALEYAKECEEGTAFGREELLLRVASVSRGKLVVVLPFNERFVGNYAVPCLHGGVVAALIDHCGGFCARSVLDNPSQRVSTVDFRLDYVVPVPCYENIICEANVIAVSNSLIRSDVVCWNESKTAKLVLGRLLFNIYTPRL